MHCQYDDEEEDDDCDDYDVDHGDDNDYHDRNGRRYTCSPSRQTHALTRVSLEKEDGSSNFQVNYFGCVRVSCSVPKRVFTFLPLPKRKVEAKVSDSIVKQLKKETMDTFRKYKQAFEKAKSSEL